MASDILSQLKVPIRGGRPDQLSRMRLRYLKMELRDNPHVNLRFIRQGVRQFIPAMKKSIDQLPVNSTLLVMPSTSLVNQVPVMLAVEINKVRPDISLLNLKYKDVTVAHRSESKIKDDYQMRAADQRRFEFSDKLVSASTRLMDSSLYILDDSISTGDSAVTLHRELLKHDINAKGIVTALAGASYASSADLQRLYRQMLPQLPSQYDKKTFQNDVFTVFAGFPRRKASTLELNFKRGKVSSGVAFDYIKQTAKYIHAHQLSPAHVIERKKALNERLGIQFKQEKDISKSSHKSRPKL